MLLCFKEKSTAHKNGFEVLVLAGALFYGLSPVKANGIYLSQTTLFWPEISPAPNLNHIKQGTIHNFLSWRGTGTCPECNNPCVVFPYIHITHEEYKSTNTTVKKKNQIPSLSMLELI